MTSRHTPSEIVRRRCTDKDHRKFLLEVIGAGVRTKITRKGIMFLGENGNGMTTHFTPSDRRATPNLRKQLQRYGIYPKGTP